MRYINIFLVLILTTCFVKNNFAQSTDKLWYEFEAEHFEESLVMGNGKMGASIFGGVQSDKIYLNDATLWSGEPVNANMNPNAHKYIPAIRAALNAENYALADSLHRFVQGSFSQSYAPLGTMFLDFQHHKSATNYHRELDISKAISTVSYEVDGVQFKREYFVSYPAQLMVIKLTSSQKEMLDFDIRFESLLQYELSTKRKTLHAKGYAPYHAEPSYRGDIPNAILFDENRGTRFSSLFKIRKTDGEIVKSDSTIGLRGGSEAIIFVSLATSFNGFDKNPATEGLKDKSIASRQLKAVFSNSYNELKSAHLADYQSFFHRVGLDLGKTNALDIPTDDRLSRYLEGGEDKNLEILYFQFGRYLLISSSRTKAVPANLQGIWNPYIRPPWSSNYTININLEENYWLAENANLSELHTPLFDFLDNLATTGAITAKTFFGVGGWVACHNTDIWAMSNPVGDFGKGHPVWANWNMGGAWLSTHLWEHYTFTKDKIFLKNRAFPLMKGAAQFCLDWLVEDENGNLIPSPCTSPENQYLTPDGYQGATLYGGTADLAIIRECFQQTIDAAKLLDIEKGFIEKLETTLARLHPYQIGKKGNLQEWYYDWEDADPKHRHQSHLFGLFPGHQISPTKTPALAAACAKTLDIKGDETTGWSKGWRINLWARLQDGNRAYKMYRELLSYVEPDAIRASDSNGGGTYPNLLDAHPPFQIDGNFGGAAAVVEMLMQSDGNQITLLPALPDAWPAGKVSGICARGGFEISMEWEKKRLMKVQVKAKHSGAIDLVFNGERRSISLEKGEDLEIGW